MTPREYFDTRSCTNKTYEFEIGRLLAHVTWANDIWTNITDRDTELTHWLRIGKVRDMNGNVGYEIIIWRFFLIFGFAEK